MIKIQENLSFIILKAILANLDIKYITSRRKTKKYEDIMKAVIPAVGFSTRFLPATKAQPKEMLPVYDKPTIQYVIEEAVNSGIDDILIVTGRNKHSTKSFDKSFEL